MRIAAFIGIGIGIVVGNLIIWRNGADTRDMLVYTALALVILLFGKTAWWAWKQYRGKSCSED